jgi:hypothetical protein
VNHEATRHARRARRSLPAPPGNIGQQMFRSCYSNARMHGESEDEAIATSIDAVRTQVPGFVPIEQ